MDDNHHVRHLVIVRLQNALWFFYTLIQMRLGA